MCFAPRRASTKQCHFAEPFALFTCFGSRAFQCHRTEYKGFHVLSFRGNIDRPPFDRLRVEFVDLLDPWQVYKLGQRIVSDLDLLAFDVLLEMLSYRLGRSFGVPSNFDGQEVLGSVCYAEPAERLCNLYLDQCWLVAIECKKRTLLLGDNEKTISECTLRLFNRSWVMSLTARKQAARSCVLDRICWPQKRV